MTVFTVQMYIHHNVNRYLHYFAIICAELIIFIAVLINPPKFELGTGEGFLLPDE